MLKIVIFKYKLINKYFVGLIKNVKDGAEKIGVYQTEIKYVKCPVCEEDDEISEVKKNKTSEYVDTSFCYKNFIDD